MNSLTRAVIGALLFTALFPLTAAGFICTLAVNATWAGVRLARDLLRTLYRAEAQSQGRTPWR